MENEIVDKANYVGVIKMVNQNPEPIVLSESFEIQAGANTDDVEITHNLAAPEMLSIFAVYVFIYPGYLDIGEDEDFPDGRRTWTDIDPLYIPVRNNPNRPDDSADPAPLFVTLPVCCNPRTWTDLTLEMLVGSNPIPSKVFNIGVVAGKLDRTLPFSTPVKVKWDQLFYVKVQNNNPAEPEFDTFSKLDIMLNCEIVNYDQLRKEQELARLRNNAVGGKPFEQAY